MPDLPDVDAQSWQNYSADRWFKQASDRINSIGSMPTQPGLGFLNSSSARIQGLQLPAPLPITAPPMPVPSLPPLPTPVPVPSPLPVPEAAPVPAPPVAPPPPVGPPPIGLPPSPVPSPPGAPPAPEAPVLPLPQTPTLPTLPGGQSTLPTPPTYAPPPAPTPVQSPFGGEATSPFAPTTTTTTTTTTTGPQGTTQTSGPVNYDPNAPAMQALNLAPAGELQNYARQAAVRAGINPEIFVAQIQQESGYNPNAGSPAGAQGIAQIVPQYHPGVDVSDPHASLDYAANLDRKLLDQYGGDWQKALIAYNGGGGAVAAWDSGQPYGESKTYVARILGSSQPNEASGISPASTTVRPQPTASTTSQFGDRQLSTDEAYAACGPAAAVRFAQAYGRNPTLREATDLATTVGWTSTQGMAGISSEQQLLQKMGVPTRLVSDVQTMAHEAQTGNPVTISTPGHYFYADAYNPQTGAFHVGQSGLDLKNGAEWMTPTQMQSLMGPIQGALLADNPQAPAVSTAAPLTDQLDQTRQTLSAALSGKPSAPPIPQQAMTQFGASPDPQIQQLDQAVQTATQRPGYLSVFDTTAAPADVARGTGASPLENLGSLIGNAIQSALQAALGGGGSPRRGTPDQNQDQYNPDTSGLQIQPQQDVGTRARAMIEQLQTLPGGGKLGNVVGVPDLLPPDLKGKSILEALQEAMDRGNQLSNLTRPSLGPGGLGLFDPRLGNDPRLEIPDLLEPIGRAAEFLGDTTGLSRLFEGAAPERAASALDRAFSEQAGARGLSQAVLDELRPPTGETLPANVFSGGDSPIQQLATDGQQSLANGLSRTRAQQVWDTVVRQLTDSGTDLNNIEQQLAQKMGRPLTDQERLGLLARVDPTHQAETMVEHAIGPQLRAIGDQALPDFYNLVEHRTNQSVAEGLARQAEADYLKGGIAPATEERLSKALDDWTAARNAHDDALAQAANPRTRDQISIAAAQRRVAESQAQLEAAAEAARQTAADAERERVLSSPTARTTTPVELRDVTIAESDARRLNQQYSKLFGTNPDNPYLESLGRQVGRAEDRAAALRAQIGERSGARGQTLEGRAQAAADTAYTTQPRYNQTPQYASANVRLRYEQQNLDRLQAQQARGISGLADDVARAENRVSKAQRDVQQAQEDLPAAARAQGWAQLHGREFAGPNGETYHYDDVVKQIADLKAKYANQPEVWARMQDALGAFQDFRTQMLQEKVDHGQISQDAMDGLLKAYDFWTPTHLSEYMSDERPGVGLQRGSSFNVGTSGLHSYTPEGSSGAHENHVAALIREAYAHKGGIAKNDVTSALVKGFGDDSTVMRRIASNVKEYVDAGGSRGNLLHPDYSLRGNEQKITGMIDGRRQDYVTSNTLLKTALDQMTQTGDASMLQKVLQAPARLVRMTATERNPAFIPVNLARDSIAYALRMGGEGGLRQGLTSAGLHLGPAALTAALTDPNDPNRGQKIAAALALGMGGRVAIGKNLGFGPSATREFMRAFADSLEGLGTGRMTGEGARALEAAGGGIRGGGVTGSMNAAQAENELRKLTRGNAFVVRNGGDLKQLLGDAAGFGWVKALGNRLEQAPRIATRNMALARGSTPLEAMIKARDVTTDFNRGGRFSREVNRYVPFFNVGTQAPAQLKRLIQEHPQAALLSGLTLLGAPAAATEAYNYSDPQRAKDYEDEPDYLKRLGISIMVPGEAPRDANGNRVPQKIFLPVPNEFMPFVEAGRQAFHRVQDVRGVTDQGQSQNLAELLSTLGQEVSPVGSANQLASPGSMLPGLGTAFQLGQNKDLFRNSTIANQYSDENASNLSKGLAPVLESAVTKLPGLSSQRVRPSQIDFALKDTLNGLATQGLNLSDLVSGRQPRVPGTAAETPLVGGLASRFVRGTGGESRTEATSPDAMMAPDIRQQLRSLGGTTQYYEPSPVPATVQKVPLRQDEQVAYQRLTNQYFDQQMRRYLATPSFSRRDVVREEMIKNAMSTARSRAEAQVLRQIRESGSSLGQRLKQQSSAF